MCERQPGQEAAAVVAPNIILHNLCVTLARCFFLYANVWDGNFFQGELFFITERTGLQCILFQLSILLTKKKEAQHVSKQDIAS